MLSFYLVVHQGRDRRRPAVARAGRRHVRQLVPGRRRRLHPVADSGRPDPHAAAAVAAPRTPGTARPLPGGAGGGGRLPGLGPAQQRPARADPDLRHAARPGARLRGLAADRVPARQLRLPVAARPAVGSRRPAHGHRGLRAGGGRPVGRGGPGWRQADLAAAAVLPARRPAPSPSTRWRSRTRRTSPSRTRWSASAAACCWPGRRAPPSGPTLAAPFIDLLGPPRPVPLQPAHRRSASPRSCSGG